jgi:adenosylmethionine-8-amino-7-oxononanoate aminotransferase
MSNVFFRVPAKSYPTAVRGKGAWLYDDKGKRYLDGSGGACVVNIGHGVSEVRDAVAAQMDRISCVHASHFVTEATEELARKVTELCGGALERVFFTSGGSEAVETAVKLVRQYWREMGQPDRYKVISRWTSYHGSSAGALALSGHTGRRRPYQPLIQHTPHIEPCYCYRCPYGKEPGSCELPCADALERTMIYEGPDSVAAFIAEPIVGASAGVLIPPDAYWPRVKEICDRHGVLIIADEVMTGVGRTGEAIAMHRWGVSPDVVTLAKGLSSGYAPLGAVVCSGDIYRAVHDGSGALAHGFTFSQHALAMAAGVAVLDYLEEHGLIERSATMGRYLLERLDSLREMEIVGDVRGAGLFAAIELVADKNRKTPFDPSLKVNAKVAEAAFASGLVTYPGGGGADGVSGDHILVSPPFVVEPAEIDWLVDILRASVEEVVRDLARGRREK